jgi:hypothetical protein
MSGSKEVDEMTIETILEAQEYLTINTGEKKKRIVDLNLLLKNHRQGAVVMFLEQVLREQERQLKHLITRDKTAVEVNETIATMFRLTMAIKTMEQEREEVKIAS